MNVKWKSNAGLIEGISYGFEFLLIDDSGDGLTPTIQCKDYFTDLWWSEHEGHKVSVYGFNWAPGKIDKNAKTYLMAVRKKGNVDMREYREPLQTFLNEFENCMEFKRTKISVGDNGGCLIVNFSAEWTKQPILISALTLLMRVGCSYDGSILSKFLDKYAEGGIKNLMAGCDKQYVKMALPNLTKLIQKGKKAFSQSYSDYTPSTTYTMHNAGGVVNYKGN